MTNKYDIYYKIKSEISDLKKNFFSIQPIFNEQSLTSPAVLLCTWFGSGLIKPMSGTWGTIAALPIAFIILTYANIYLLLTFTIILYLLGIHVIKIYFGKNKLEDRSEIVIDEVVGVWIALLFSETNYYKWFLIFLIFRVLDISKPWPAKIFDKKTTNAHNIMLDDVVVGIYTIIIVELIWYFVR